MTALSILLIIVAVFLFLLNSPALGCLTLLVSALVFITGNRIRRERIERQRHEEMKEVMRRDRQ